MGAALTAGRSAAEAVAPRAKIAAQYKTIIFEEELSWLICLTMQVAGVAIIAEVTIWHGHPPERLQQMKDGLARLKAEGADIID